MSEELSAQISDRTLLPHWLAVKNALGERGRHRQPPPQCSGTPAARVVSACSRSIAAKIRFHAA